MSWRPSAKATHPVPELWVDDRLLLSLPSPEPLRDASGPVADLYPRRTSRPMPARQMQMDLATSCRPKYAEEQGVSGRLGIRSQAFPSFPGLPNYVGPVITTTGRRTGNSVQNSLVMFAVRGTKTTDKQVVDNAARFIKS